MKTSRMTSHFAIITTVLLVCSGLVVAQPQRDSSGAVSLTTSASATVKLVDPATRTILLETPEGYIRSIRCGNAMANFNQIKVGDQVKAMAMDRMAVFMGKSAPGTEDAAIIARAPKGAMPGLLIVDSDDITARIAAVDMANRTVTLAGAASLTKPLAVSADLDLAGVKTGDEVTIRVTKGLALWVQNPQDGAHSAAAVLGAQGTDAVPGAAGLDSISATATVEAIDRDTRMVTLKGESGLTRQIYLGKSAINFDQIQVGDKVRATLAEEVAVAVSKGGALPMAGDGTFVARAPMGSRPGLVISDTSQITGKLQSTDRDKRTITLIEAGDTTPQTIQVGPRVNLAELNAGDTITARVTQALAILVEKP